ncbi:MAG: hypothetical protein EF813_11600 [Methanosarcinales archaeon]|nr:MAG: hypothetical protein EF813_11600 [Methanosarcinales archaeon]
MSVSLVSAEDYPTLPNRFSGDVMLNGELAPVGTVIDAYIGGDPRGTATVENPGKYVWLEVKGSSPDDGSTITFTVGGVDADRTETWIEGEGQRSLGLTAGELSVSPPSNGGGSSSGGGGSFPPSSGVVVNDTSGTDTPSVPDDDATSDEPSADATIVATDDSSEAGSEEEANGTVPWTVLVLAGLAVAAIVVYLMRK